MTTVPRRAPFFGIAGGEHFLRASKPVVGTNQWHRLARRYAYLLGHNGPLIQRGPEMTIAGGATIAASATREYRFWVWPHEQCTHRTWYYSICTNTDGAAYGTIEVNEDSAGYVTIGTWAIDEAVPARQPILFRAPQIVDPDDTPREVAVRFGNTAGVAVLMAGVKCVETPRATIVDGDITGVTIPHDDSVRSTLPIFADASNDLSADATFRSQSVARSHARRSSMFNWASPTAISSTATVFDGTSNVFTFAPGFLARKQLNGAVVGEIAFKALVRGDGGAGELRLLASSGDSTTVAIPSNASLQWSADAVLDVDCTDMSTLDTDGGLQGGTVDTIQVEIRRTTATTVFIGSLNIGEAQ